MTLWVLEAIFWRKKFLEKTKNGENPDGKWFPSPSPFLEKVSISLHLQMEKNRRRRLFHSSAARRPTLSARRPTLRMAVVSVWSLEEDTLKATFT